MVAAVETMAYTGAVPWHGLGEKLEIDVSLDEFRRKAGLTWEVEKLSLIHISEPTRPY